MHFPFRTELKRWHGSVILCHLQFFKIDLIRFVILSLNLETDTYCDQNCMYSMSYTMQGVPSPKTEGYRPKLQDRSPKTEVQRPKLEIHICLVFGVRSVGFDLWDFDFGLLLTLKSVCTWYYSMSTYIKVWSLYWHPKGSSSHRLPYSWPCLHANRFSPDEILIYFFSRRLHILYYYTTYHNNIFITKIFGWEGRL